MESAIQASNPARWERHLMRRNEDKEGDEERPHPGTENPLDPPAVADGEEDAVYSDGEPGVEDLSG